MLVTHLIRQRILAEVGRGNEAPSAPSKQISVILVQADIRHDWRILTITGTHFQVPQSQHAYNMYSNRIQSAHVSTESAHEHHITNQVQTVHVQNTTTDAHISEEVL